MNYEQFLTKISDSSWCYRWSLTILLSFASMKAAFNIFVLVLTTAPVPFHCAEAVLNNETVPWSTVQANASSLVNISDFECKRPRFASSDAGDLQLLEAHNINDDCRSWTFLPDMPSRRSMFTEYEMVCDRSYLKNRLQTVMQLGKVIATFTGPLGDIWGRKSLLVAFAFFDLAANVGMIFASSLTAQLAMLFCMGSIGQSVAASFILAAELVGEPYRSSHGNLFWIMYIIGYVASAAVCYFVPNWRWQMVVVVALAACGYVTYVPYVPESPRWLLVTGRRNRAKKIVREMCRFSGCRELADQYDIDNNELANNRQGKRWLPHDSICNAIFLVTLGITTFTFFTCALVYFALAFKRDFIISDPYLNVLISGLLELPANVLAWQVCERIGRKYPTMILLLLCGIGLLVLPYTPRLSFPLRAVLAIIVKFCITSAFSVYLVFSAELLPTNLRSGAFFFTCLVMRAAQMVAPELGGLLAKWYDPLPNLLYGAFTCAAAATLFVLPETKDRAMPNKVAEMPAVACCQQRPRSRTIDIDAESEQLKS